MTSLPVNFTQSFQPTVYLYFYKAYTLLHEAAASNGANQQKLRDPQVLGG